MLEYCATCLSKDRRLTQLSCLGPAIVSLNWNIQPTLQRLSGLVKEETASHVILECVGVASHREQILGTPGSLLEACESPRRLLSFWKELGWLDWLANPLTQNGPPYESKCGKWNVDRDGVCFECKGVLMKIHRFRLQVEAAGALVELARRCHKCPEPLSAFSRLSTTLKTAYDDVFQNTDFDVKDESYVVFEHNNCGTEIRLLTHTSHEDEDAKISQKPETHHHIQYIEIKEENAQIIEETNTSEENHELLNEHNKVAKKTNKNKLKKLKKPAHGDFLRLTRIEERFYVKRMSDEEMCTARESDTKRLRFKSATYKCLKCITGYYSEERYNHHMKIKHCKEQPHQCPVCEVRFSRKDALQHHHESHYKLYRCKECDFSSHHLQSMLLHSSKEHEFKTYDCKVCGKGFITFTLLRYHTAKTHRERPACDVCGKAFVTAHALKVHARSHLPGASARAQCPQCGGHYRQLAPHLRTHAAPARDAYCAECARHFRDAYIYRRHLLTHRNHRQSDALKHACAHCEAKFANKTNLTRHVAARHTREFLFSCDICGKGYHRKDRLAQHAAEVHQGVARPKDKLCGVCGKAFKDRAVLKIHLRTHSGERPHRCARCPRRFAQRASLRAHERALHALHAPSDPAQGTL